MLKILKKTLKPFLIPLWFQYLKAKDYLYQIKGYRYNLSVCAMFQNEARWLREWIEFHRLVGVDHFWLYNNNSDDNYLEILAPYIKEGIIELIEWPSEVREDEWHHFAFTTQTDIYKDAIKRSQSKTRWLAAIDIDEFIFSPKEKKLNQLLDTHYSDCYGICVNWQCFGTSNVSEIKKDELLIEKLIMKAEENHKNNQYYKSIFRPQYVVNCQNPHFFDYHPHVNHVDARKRKIGMHSEGIFIDNIRINHYWSKDNKFFNEVKIPRWQKWGRDINEIVKDNNEFNAISDNSLSPYIDQLREVIMKRKANEC